MALSALSADDYGQRLVGLLSQAADPLRAVPMRAYMRNQFDFYGIMAGPRHQLLRSFLLAEGMPSDVRTVIRALWKEDARECQYVACALLLRAKKKMSMDDVPFFEELITTKSWWDTVDAIAPNVAGVVALHAHAHATRQLAERWISAPNMWLQRSAILLQLKYKDKTDEALLFDLVLRHASSTEFFLQKAAGWALRQYAYVAPVAVRMFVDAHRSQLSGLTIREALKHASS